MAALATLVIVSLTGCAPANRTTVSSSLVDYLYPKGDPTPPDSQATPVLNLPLNVGIAFVPNLGPDAPSEAHKVALLERTRSAFQGRPYINQIVVIPEAYMTTGNGFEPLDRVARLFNLDIIALVSYDQVENTNPNLLSVTYMTIVGAFLLPGSGHEASTFVDTAVFDVRTHALLFRAAGASSGQGLSTGVGETARRRDLMDEGFDKAMADMTASLNREVDGFKSRIKSDQTVQVAYRPSYKGGASAMDIGLLLLIPILGWWRRRVRAK